MTMDEKRITGHGQGADAGGKEKRKCRAGTMKTRGQLDKGPLVTMYITLEASGNTVENLCFAQRSSGELWGDIVDDGVNGKALHQPFELLW